MIYRASVRDGRIIVMEEVVSAKCTFEQYLTYVSSFVRAYVYPGHNLVFAKSLQESDLQFHIEASSFKGACETMEDIIRLDLHKR